MQTDLFYKDMLSHKKLAQDGACSRITQGICSLQNLIPRERYTVLVQDPKSSKIDKGRFYRLSPNGFYVGYLISVIVIQKSARCII